MPETVGGCAIEKSGDCKWCTAGKIDNDNVEYEHRRRERQWAYQADTSWQFGLRLAANARVYSGVEESWNSATVKIVLFIWQFAKFDRSGFAKRKIKKFLLFVIAKTAKSRVHIMASYLQDKRAEQIRTIREFISGIHREQGGYALMPKIKVIKKGEAKPVPAVAPVKEPSKKAAAREMVSTVSNWVSDFKQRKHEETKLSLEGFFPPRPATSRP